MKTVCKIESPKRYLTQVELALVLNTSPRTIQRFVNQGMPCFYLKPNRKASAPRYDLEKVVTWLEIRSEMKKGGKKK